MRTSMIAMMAALSFVGMQVPAMASTGTRLTVDTIAAETTGVDNGRAIVQNEMSGVNNARLAWVDSTRAADQGDRQANAGEATGVDNARLFAQAEATGVNNARLS